MQCIMSIYVAHTCNNMIILNIHIFGLCVQVPEECISKSRRNDIAGYTGTE